MLLFFFIFKGLGNLRKLNKKYTNDKLDGFFEERWENGVQTIKGQYKNGIRIGKWEYFKTDGTMQSQVNYDENGIIISEINISNIKL